MELGSGTYHYEYATDTRLEPQKYTMDTPIGELVKVPSFLEKVDAVMPGTSQGMKMEFMQGKTLREMLTMIPGGGGATAAAFEGILTQLNAAEG